MKRSAVIAVVVAVALALGVGTSAAATMSGSVVAVHRDAGTLVIGEVGPWQIKGGQTVITERTVTVTPETRFVRVRRAANAGPSGYRGEFVEEALAAWAVKEGDFVTVTARRVGARLEAERVTVAGP